MTTQSRGSTWRYAARIGALVVAISLIDMTTSVQMIGAILYTLPIALCAFHGSRRLLWATVAVSLVMTVAGGHWGVERAAALEPVALFNRALLSGSLFTLAAFIHLGLNRRDATALAMAEVEKNRVSLVAQNAQLESMEARYRALLESAPDAMVIANHQGHIVMVNTQTEHQFGYLRHELLGQPVEMLVPKRFRGAHPTQRAGYADRPIARAMGSGIELMGLRKDGTEFDIEVSLSPVQTAEGRLVLSTIRDVTARQLTLAALKASNLELEAFSYSVAHDLRTPLRGMNGFAHLLLSTYNDKLDAEGLGWLDEIVRNANKMGALIDALLSLARVTRGQPRPERVDLSALVRSALQQLSAREPSRSITSSIEEGLTAELDPSLARVLVDNLVANALKFTSKTPAPRLEFGASDEGGVRHFFIRDNGAGFDMAFAAKLFVPFQRLHTVAEYPGTGIGLATAQRIVQRHGGRIWADSKVGEGATFSFSLPSQPRAK